jgi:hypothetical protein
VASQDPTLSKELVEQEIKKREKVANGEFLK